jgi:hypothetical protein
MLPREGANVVIADLEREGRQVADAIGASTRFKPFDVTQEENWAAAAVAAATTRHCGDHDRAGAGVMGDDRGANADDRQNTCAPAEYERMAMEKLAALQRSTLYSNIRPRPREQCWRLGTEARPQRRSACAGSAEPLNSAKLFQN